LDHNGSTDFKLEGHQAKTTAVDDTLAYSPYKGLTLVQLRSVQKEFRKRNEEQRVEHAKELQRELQKHSEEQRVEHARELQVKEQGIANNLQRIIDIQAETTTILCTILNVDIANEVFTHPRTDPYLEEWDATNTKK
jgi:hypothetical protein